MSGRSPRGAAALVAVWLLAACGGGGDDAGDGEATDLVRPIATTPDAGDALPVVEIVDAGGEPVSSVELIGEPAVVNFWFSACAPCVREMPALQATNEAFGGAVRFVGVNPIDDRSRAAEFAAERGVDYDLYGDPRGELVDGAEVASFPTTMLVDADGTIVHVHAGEIDQVELEAVIVEHLGIEPA